jgi:parallel beta-helix repeat protein
VEKRIDISACGTISESGSYYVTQNLSTTGTCITVTADDVTIDLNGFTLTGDGSATHFGIWINNVSNVEVKNGTVRFFEVGINGTWSGTVTESNRVIKVRAMGNGISLASNNNLVKDCTAADSTSFPGYGILAGGGSTVTNNTAYNNQGNGITTGNGCTVTNNTVYNNQDSGITTGNGCTVTNNTARDNQSAGISVLNGCTVTNNTAYNSLYAGIHAGLGCSVTNNTVYGNNWSDSTVEGGIRVSSGCIVKNNTLRGNQQNNIFVFGYDNAIEENLVTGSGNGISFFSGGNFYANNRARGNATNYNNNGSTNTDGGGNVEF